jgi:hypothetical protein
VVPGRFSPYNQATTPTPVIAVFIASSPQLEVLQILSGVFKIYYYYHAPPLNHRISSTIVSPNIGKTGSFEGLSVQLGEVSLNIGNLF